MNDKKSFLQAVAWDLGVSFDYVKSHYEDYIQFYQFKAEHFYNVVKMFMKKDGGKIATKKGFK